MMRRRSLLGAAGLCVLPALAALPAGLDRHDELDLTGGGMDAMARLLAHHWTTEQQQPTVVINRAGASGNIGTASVARSKPDGLTLLLTGLSHLTSPMLHTNPGYEPLDDFVPVARMGTTPNVLLVSDALKGMTLPQLLQDARSRSGGLSFGSAGYGHSSHLAAEVFMGRTGAKWLHVPYKGNGPAQRALVAGEVQLLFLSATSVSAAVATGRAHPVAVAHRQRLDALPDTPTFTELGVRNAEIAQWYGLFAPAGTPAETVRALSAMVVKAVRHPAFAAQLATHSVHADPMEPEQFAAFLRSEHRRLDALLKKERVERPMN